MGNEKTDETAIRRDKHEVNQKTRRETEGVFSLTLPVEQ